MAKPITSNSIDLKANTSDSHQTSPAWMLTFVSFTNPSPNNPISPEYLGPATKTKNNKKAWNSQTQDNAVTTRKPFVVTSDCIQLSINQTKSSHNGSLSAVLVGGKYEYMAKIAPGDYVYANILDFGEDMFDVSNPDSLLNRAISGKDINRFYDGFKGVFKVTSVQRSVAVSESGAKRVIYQIQALSFTELNNSIYFNPYISASLQQGGDLFYLTNISEAYQNKIGIPSGLENIVNTLLTLTLGAGPRLKDVNIDLKKINAGKETVAVPSINVSPNRLFKVPALVGSLLNINTAKSFNDLYRFMFGIQKYEKFTKENPKTGKKEINPAGYQPFFNKTKDNYYRTNLRISGLTTIRPEYFNQSTGWSIINSYCNAPINEMFTTFRLSPEGFVMPFLIFRQIPFSSWGFAKKNKQSTAFLSLPRWKVDPKIVMSASIGRDEAMRFNFVQVFGRPFGWEASAQDAAIARQNATGANYSSDGTDISRSGLKPYVIQNSLDFPNANGGFQSPYWAKMLGDAVIGGHMKLSGSLRCVGIEEPIPVGDNLEFDGIAYHIEGVRHDCAVEENGSKIFTTTFSLSHGVDITENDEYTVYGYRIFEDYQKALDSVGDAQYILPQATNDQPEQLNQNSDSNTGLRLPDKLIIPRGGIV